MPGIRAMAAAAGLACMLLLGAGASAQTPSGPPPAAGVPRIAVVDLLKVDQGYTQLATRSQELNQWASQQDAYLNDLRMKYSYLSEENFREVLDILATPRPWAAPKAKRERELREINDAKDARFVELQAKVDRTPQEQEEFNGLQEISDSRLKQIQAMADKLRQQFAQRRDQARTDLSNAVTAAVKDIATQGGYTLVLDKQGVLFGGDDITDTVLQRLNGAAPTTTPTTTPPAGPAPGGPETAPTTPPVTPPDGGGAPPADAPTTPPPAGGGQ